MTPRIAMQPVSITSTQESSIIERVSYDRDKLVIELGIYPSEANQIVTFRSVLGFRMLDERDLSEFVEAGYGAWLYEVSHGGWFSQESLRSPIMACGFYGTAKEYFVSGEDYCISVLTLNDPVVSFGNSGE